MTWSEIQLYNAFVPCNSMPAMWKKLLPLMFAPLLLAGCATTFTNLTPLQQPRNPNNLYPVEVEFDNHETALRWDSIQPSVLVGSESYPMRKVPIVPNRWEGLVPVPAGTDAATYRYKFDFLRNNFGGPTTDTLFSLKYNLKVTEQ
jgi:hypothetical protein